MRTETILEQLKNGQSFDLPTITQEKLVDLGWHFEPEDKFENFVLRLNYNNNEPSLIADIPNGDPVFVAESLEQMGGVEGFRQLLENGNPVKRD